MLPPLWSLTQEPRPLRPALLLSRRQHPLSPVVKPRVAVPVQAEQAPVAQVREVLVQVVRAVPVREVQARVVPAETRALLAAVPRRPVLREAEPPPVVVPQAVLPQVPAVVHPSVAVLRSAVVHPLVAVPQPVAARRSPAADLLELPWWTQPVSLRALRWWTHRSSDL